MKITKRQLKRIIREEYQKVIKEGIAGTVGYHLGMKDHHPVHEMCLQLKELFPEATEEQLAFAFLLGENPANGLKSARKEKDQECYNILFRALSIWKEYHDVPEGGELPSDRRRKNQLRSVSPDVVDWQKDGWEYEKHGVMPGTSKENT